MKNKSNDHSPREDYMQEECLHLNKIKQGNMRGSHYWLSYPSSLQSGIIPDKSGVSKLQLQTCSLLCLETHASGSGFSKKVFLIQSNGCKRSTIFFQKKQTKKGPKSKGKIEQKLTSTRFL